MQLNKPAQAKKLLLIQLVFLVLVPLFLLPVSTVISLSGFVGGAIAVFANIILYILVFRPYTAQQPGKMVANIYMAEIAKLIFTMAAFAFVVLNVQPINFAALIVVFFLIQVLPALLINYR